MGKRTILVLGAMLTVIIIQAGVAVYYLNVINQKDREILTLEMEKQELSDELEFTRNSMQQQIDDWTARYWKASNETLDYKTRLEAAQNLTNILIDAINGKGQGNLTTAVFHACNKDLGWLPNATDFYNRIKNGTELEVVLQPEWWGNSNATAMNEWIVANFSGIPIAYPFWEGGEYSTPNLMQDVGAVDWAVDNLNVRFIRISEPVSWYMEPNRTFPYEYFRNVLERCRQRNVRVLWSEWKISEDAMRIWRNVTAGYEDMIVMTYETNNVYDEPIAGYLKMLEFPHRGASVQPWYWRDRGLGSEMDMPIDLLAWHAVLARNIGVEVIQFEPYWYLFDDGELTDRFTTLRVMVL